MLTVAVLLALTARWCFAAPTAGEYFVRGARKIDGDPTALMLDYHDYTRSDPGKITIGTDSPQSTGAYFGGGSTSYEPSWDWSLFGAGTGQPALAEKVSLDKKHKAIPTPDLSSLLSSIPSLPTLSLPSFLTPSTASVASVPTPTFSSSLFPNLNFFQPALSSLASSGLFPTNIPKPTWPSTSSFPLIRLPGSSIKRSGTATVNGVPAPQTQLLVISYPNVFQFFRDGFSSIVQGFNSVRTFFNGFGNVLGNGIVIRSRTEPEDGSTHKDWDI